MSKNMKETWQGQESICRPVSLKFNLLSITYWPADRLLALPGPFHVSYPFGRGVNLTYLKQKAVVTLIKSLKFIYV